METEAITPPNITGENGVEPETKEPIKQVQTERQEDKEKSEIDKAIELTTEFVNRLFGENVPERVAQRLSTVKDSIILSTAKLESNYLEQGGTEYLMRRTMAYYSRSQDRIYLRDGTPINTKIHEIFHYISADPDNGESGLKTENGVATKHGGALDEAITVMLTTYAENRLNPHQVSDLSKVKRELSTSKDLAGSYLGSVENFANMVYGFVGWGDTKVNDRRLYELLPEIYQDYFHGHQSKLKNDIDSKFGEGHFNEFMKSVDKAGLFDLIRTRTFIESRSKNVFEGEFYPAEIKDKVTEFLKAINDEEVTQIQYSENLPYLCRITPALDLGSLKVGAEIQLNVALRKIYDSTESRKDLMSIKQFETWIIWQSIVYSEAKKGVSLSNNDFYKNVTMREILKKNGVSQLSAINTMVRGLMGVRIPSDELEVLASEALKGNSAIA